MKKFYFILIISIAFIFQYIYNNSGYFINTISENSEISNYKPYNFKYHNMSQGAKCIVIGGTGATGKHLIRELVDSKFVQITSLVRKEDPSIQNEKLKQVVVDFDKLENYKEEFKDKDVAFNVLGTTRKQAGSAERFREIELGISSKFADLSKESGVRSMHLLSSAGSNPNSFFLYTKVKGEIEENMKKEGFHYLSIFRPGFLDRGVGDRWVENVIIKVVSSMKVSTLAKAMRIEAENELLNSPPSNTVKIYSNKEINEIAGEK
ncbi:hypothetical protein ACTFIY_007415 [Dictyostelium cf. discoideum]